MRLVTSHNYDALVVGSGPAGSVAALVLARGGARVALVDKASFPRDKACGDLVGPRGVQVLTELGIEVHGGEPVDDMVVVGPRGRQVHLPCWEGDTYPGYGCLFPGVDGRANIGLGLGVLADRSAGGRAARSFDSFTEDLRRFGVLVGPAASVSGRLGGWLKMGMVGTVPGRGRVLLVGDATGLVNPLQGEGIAQAMASARAAAEAVLAGPDQAATRYRAFLAATYAPYQSITAPVHGA